jgi:hypothetical protein
MQTGSAANLDKPPCRRGGPYVYEGLDDPLVLSRMARPGAHVGKAELLQKLSDIARVKVDAESLSDDALEVDPPPPHDAILLTIRPDPDDLRKLGPLLLRQARLGTPVQLSMRPPGPAALKRCTQSRSVWRSEERGVRQSRPNHPIAQILALSPSHQSLRRRGNAIRAPITRIGDVGAGRGGTVRDRRRHGDRLGCGARETDDRTARRQGPPKGGKLDPIATISWR